MQVAVFVGHDNGEFVRRHEPREHGCGRCRGRRQFVPGKQGSNVAVGVEQVAVLIGAVEFAGPHCLEEFKSSVWRQKTASQHCDLAFEH